MVGMEGVVKIAEKKEKGLIINTFIT